MAEKNKTQSKKVRAQGQNNKLISIRIPEEVIERLREVADEKGGGGYQQLIKNYISEGLTGEDGAMAAVKTKPRVDETPLSFPQTADQRRTAKTVILDHNEDVIAEDIRALAHSLRNNLDDFAGKTFLITGAFGFLGRYMVHLLKYLNDHELTGSRRLKALLLDNFVTGYEQRIINDPNLVFCRHDVIKPFATDLPVDYIIHAAGIASPAYYTKFPIETMDVGTVGTRNMLELARQKNVRGFLFTSSSEVYGDPDPKHVPTNEEYFGNVSVSGPRACYDESKRFGETLCLAYYRVYNVPVKIVRPFNVYGPGIRPDDYRVLPNFIEHALRKEPLPIHGAGHNTRSFCYINDEVEAIFKLLFCEKANGESFNVGNPAPEISVRDLAKKVTEAMPFKVDIVNIDPPHAVYSNSDPKRRCPDISKLTATIDFKPKYSLDEGLRRTIRWFSSK